MPRMMLFCLSALFAAGLAPAQDGGRFSAKPTTPAEIWKEIGIERDLGNPEIAAKWLRALLAKDPTDKDLLEIADKDGVLAVSRLVAIREWSEKDAKLNEQARKDSVALLQKVQDAIRKRAKDEGYIKGLIAQLRAETEEERTYAVREIVRVGATTVPYLLDEYARTRNDGERIWLRRVLDRMGPTAAGPLLAGLDGYSDKPVVKMMILDLLRRRHAAAARQVIPFLWYVMANRGEDGLVRKHAAELLADLQEVPVSKLTPAKVALTREAERYLNHDVRFVEPILVWRWDGKAVVEGLPGGAAATPTNAEAYYGTKFAKQALDLDPDYRPAQAALLTLSIEKAAEGGGTLPDALASIVNKADLSFLLDLLDRSLREERTAVVLPLVQAIGRRGEVRALRPLTKGDPPLVRALDYPDLRVRLAAVEALITIPGPPPPHTVKRVLEVLRNALSPASTSATTAIAPRVLVAIGDDSWRAKVVRALGEGAVEAKSGRDAMRKLKDDASIQALVTESTLPFPGMAHFLAQVRADVGLKKLPIVLAAVPESRASVEAAGKYAAYALQRDGILKQSRNYVEDLSSAQRERDDELRQAFRDKALYTESFRESVARLDADFEARRKELTVETPDLVKQLRMLEERHKSLMALMESRASNLSESARRDFELANERFEAKRVALEKESLVAALSYHRLDGVEARMKQEAEKYDRESRIREGSLTRFTSRYPGVTVVQTAALVNPEELRTALATLRRAAPPPPNPAALGSNAETALRILHALASGTPRGYDVAPVGEAVLNALRNGKLSEQGQLYAVGIASRLPGNRPQPELADVLTDGGRPAKVRLAAADGLVQHVQKFGNVLPAAQRKTLDALAGQAGLDAALKEKAEMLAGILRGGARGTGDGLREYDPKPPGKVIPPPKED